MHMYICAYVYICFIGLNMYICVYICMFMCTYICVRMYVDMCIYAYLSMCIRSHIHVDDISICGCIDLWPYIWTYGYMGIWVYGLWICVYADILTHGYMDI